MAYHILGDSNISRYLSVVKTLSSDPQYGSITYTKTTNLVLLRDALTKPEIAHPIIVISAVTNLLTSSYFDNYDRMIDHCKSTFSDLLTWVQEGRNSLDGFADQVYSLVNMRSNFVLLASKFWPPINCYFVLLWNQLATTYALVIHLSPYQFT